MCHTQPDAADATLQELRGPATEERSVASGLHRVETGRNGVPVNNAAMDAIPARASRRDALQVRIVRGLDELEAVRGAWHRLWRSVESCAVYSLPEYVIPYLRHRLPPDREWAGVLVLDAGQLIGVFPAVYGPAELLPRLGCRFLSPYEFLPDCVVAAERAEEVFPEILRGLGEAVPGWRRLDLNEVREDSPTAKFLDHPPVGYRLRRVVCGHGSYLPTTGSFEDYYRGLSHNFRGNLRKARRKLEQLRDVRPLLQSPGRFDEADFQRFVDLEASGWKGAQGEAIKKRETWVNFYREFIAGLARANCLALNFLAAEDRVIAAQLGIHTGSRLSILKIAYDENYARCAPGNLLWSMQLEAAFASDEIREVDALSDMPWHRDWKMRRRSYYSLRIVPRSLLPTLVTFYEEKVPGARACAKRALGRIPGLLPLVQSIRHGGPGAGHGQ